MFVIILYQSILIRYRLTYSYNYTNIQNSYLSNYMISIISLQREPIKS